MKKNKEQVKNQNRVILRELLVEIPQWNYKIDYFDTSRMNDNQLLSMFCVKEVLKENNDNEIFLETLSVNGDYLVEKFGKSAIAKGKTAVRKVYNGEIDLKGLNGYMRFFIGNVQICAMLSYEQNIKKQGYDSISNGESCFIGS